MSNPLHQLINTKSKVMRLMVLCALALSACQAPQEPVVVAVYPGSRQCQVQEKPIDCAQVGTYLRDTLQLKLNRQIDVSVTGVDPGSKEDPFVDQVANVVRQAGFKEVRAVRFEL